MRSGEQKLNIFLNSSCYWRGLTAVLCSHCPLVISIDLFVCGGFLVKLRLVLNDSLKLLRFIAECICSLDCQVYFDVCNFSSICWSVWIYLFFFFFCCVYNFYSRLLLFEVCWFCCFCCYCCCLLLRLFKCLPFRLPIPIHCELLIRHTLEYGDYF